LAFVSRLQKPDMELIENISFQDPATPVMEGIINLHNYIFMYLILISVFVFYIFSNILYDWYFLQYKHFHFHIKWVTWIRKHTLQSHNFNHESDLEVLWTLIPAIILALIAMPSFILLYSMDEVLTPALTFKAIGHQWYWSYEFSDYLEEITLVFDSNMIYENELQEGESRLLTVDNPVIIPTNTHIRVIITSMDVLHSWAVPSFGIKVDACPGRLNQAFIYLKREGVFLWSM